MKLGLLGFSGTDAKSRTNTLGIYRPESNRHIQNYNGKSKLYQFWGKKQVIDSTTLKSITGLTFKPDGTEVYVLTSTLSPADRSVYQYNLPIPWDITSISSITPTSSAELSSYLQSVTGNVYNLTLPTGIDFSSDGSKMIILNNFDDKIFQFTLTTPWLVSSRTFTSTSIDNDRPYMQLPNFSTDADLCFSTDGTKLFILATTTASPYPYTVYQYNSNTAFDIGTKGSPNYVSYSSLNVNSLEGAATGISFDNNGKKMYITGTNNARIYDVDLTSPFLFDLSNPVNYDNAGGYLYDGLLSGREGSPQAVYVNKTGNNMDLYVVGNMSTFGASKQNIIYQYKLIQR